MATGSLLQRMFTPDLHKLLGEKEVAYGKETKYGDLVCVCPFCEKPVIVFKDNVEPTGNRITATRKLKKPVACGCRKNIDTINIDFLQQLEGERSQKMTGRLVSLAVASAIPILIFLAGGSAGNLPETVALLLFALFVIGAAGLVFCVIMLIDLLFCDGHSKFLVGGMEKDYMAIVDRGKKRMEMVEDRRREKARRERDSEQKGDAGPIHGFNGGTSSGAGSAAVGCAAGDRAYDSPDSYVPDDYEPDLDPYDRQALYDEEVLDDFILAGGGDPYDLDDRMDAFSDPFGFGDD